MSTYFEKYPLKHEQMDSGKFFSEIQYLLLETIPLDTIMRVITNSFGDIQVEVLATSCSCTPKYQKLMSDI